MSDAPDARARPVPDAQRRAPNLSIVPLPLPDALLREPRRLVLALPGMGCSPRIFGALADALASAPLVLHGVDWGRAPGTGSPRAIARQIADALRARSGPTALVGHSAGCVIGLMVALQAPAGLDALVLSNSGAHASGHGDPTLPALIAGEGWTPEAQRAFLQACMRQPPPGAGWDDLADYLGSLRRDALLACLREVRSIDLRDALHRIACPTLVAHGEFDRRRPLHFAQELAAGIPGARLRLLPGGHTPMADCPDDYVAAVRDFLLTPPRGHPAP